MMEMMRDLPKILMMVDESEDAFIEVVDFREKDAVVFKERFTPDAVNNFGRFIKERNYKPSSIITRIEDGIFTFRFIAA